MPKRKAKPLTEEQKTLVERNVNLVAHMVKTISFCREMDKDEAMSAGHVGLCQAARSYDPAKAAFSSYACVAIRAKILEDYYKSKKRGFSRMGRAATKKHKLPKVHSIDARMNTKDTYCGGDDTCNEYIDIMGNDGQQLSICELVDVSMTDILAWCRANLTEKQWVIFEMRQLQGLQFREIAKIIGHSHQNAQQTYELALARIRKHFVGQAWDTEQKQ